MLEGNVLTVPRLPVDTAFADSVLPRLFTLPSRILHDEWKSIAAAIGSSATPPTEEAPATASPSNPASTGSASSFDDLLAKLKRAEAKVQDVAAKTRRQAALLPCL